MDLLLKDRQQLLSLLKHNLTVAHEKMKWYADKKRVDRSFNVGDWVYLRLQPYKQASVHHQNLGMLAPRFYGPFQILQKIGQVSYKLDLPTSSLIHPIFHVSNLKAKVSQHVQPRSTLPTVFADLVLSPKPVSILVDRSHQLRNRVITQVLVQWQGESNKDATWENLFDL